MRGAPPCPIQKDQRDRPQHRELHALLFSMSVWVHALYDKKERSRPRKQSGAVEACWAHNPEVRGSKPRSAKIILSFFVLTIKRT